MDVVLELKLGLEAARSSTHCRNTVLWREGNHEDEHQSKTNRKTRIQHEERGKEEGTAAEDEAETNHAHQMCFRQTHNHQRMRALAN